ncbi:hypothetical protein BDV96DRAFT_639558 [Lophiotrema nucula]|uniref:Amidohydrolase-related domain-containing protein n=1 Tax=Lophiotrema nucula TaxID=690887 RepID=A0A6A5ZW62_9PLEO|nr:hypothetical protein BDV96DRAFT_639558 [Lophiotrema nucula]
MKLRILLNTSSLAPSVSACFSHSQHARRDVSPLQRRILSPVGKTVITNISVFDGYEMTPSRTVIIEGEKNGSYDTRCQRHGTFHYLIPGLIDSHLHLNVPSHLEVLTSYGITTAFQMSCHNDTQCAMFKGHPDLCDSSLQAYQPSGQAVITQAVDYVFSNNSDYFKITVETNGPSPSSQAELVPAAHDIGQQTMSHCADMKSYLQTIESGSNGLQHIPQNGILNTSAIEQMLRQHQYTTPTMTVFEYDLSNTQAAARLGANGSFEYGRANVALLHSFGVPILAGTDAAGTITARWPILRARWILRRYG